jgi:hypothetical protein
MFLGGLERAGYGQTIDTSAFSEPILMDEVVITAQQHGFDVQTFIELIKNDTTFYKAYRSLHLVTFNATNNIEVFDKQRKKKVATLQSETKQVYRDGCRSMNVLEEKTSGDFYNKN